MKVSKRSVGEVRRAAVKISDLYGGGETGHLMQGQYATNVKVLKAVTQRHKRYGKHIDEQGYFHADEHTWKVPFGVRLCLKKTLVSNQITVQRPWAVVWRSTKTGKRVKKHFSTPHGAIMFITTQAQYVDPHATIISRTYGYDVPARLRGKIPKPWRWCPYCMTARRFKAVVPQVIFYAAIKEWNENKARYEYRDRKLRLMKCDVCGCTNRDSKMRRSNQPWEVRRFKKGVRRAKRRTR